MATGALGAAHDIPTTPHRTNTERMICSTRVPVRSSTKKQRASGLHSAVQDGLATFRRLRDQAATLGSSEPCLPTRPGQCRLGYGTALRQSLALVRHSPIRSARSMSSTTTSLFAHRGTHDHRHGGAGTHRGSQSSMSSTGGPACRTTRRPRHLAAVPGGHPAFRNKTLRSCT